MPRAVCAFLMLLTRPRAQRPQEMRKQASTTTERHITTSTNSALLQAPQHTRPHTHTPTHTHTHTVVEPLLKLAEEPVEDVAGQKD